MPCVFSANCVRKSLRETLQEVPWFDDITVQCKGQQKKISGDRCAICDINHGIGE